MLLRYKLSIWIAGFVLLLGMFPTKGHSQITNITRDTTILVKCKQLYPLDLFKLMAFQAMPSNGYWGDAAGKPLKNGNIFVPTNPGKGVESSDTTFHFYITSQKDYCGLSQGATMTLKLKMNYDCDGETDKDFIKKLFFCFNSNVEMASGKTIASNSFADVVLAIQPDRILEQLKDASGNWVPHTIQDMQGNPYNWNFSTNRNPNGTEDSILLIIPSLSIRDIVVIKVHPKSELRITYSPEIISTKEYDITDDFNITAQDPELLQSIKFYMNDKYLNDYFLGGDTTNINIKLNALVFTGLEDVIRVTALDANKCFLESTDVVTVNVPFPNVFTPDGDGVNDVFLGGEKFRNREFVLEVFNRWGDRLYMGNNGWDGTYRGAPVPPGTYAFAVNIKGPDGNARLVKGMVTLIRKVD